MSLLRGSPIRLKEGQNQSQSKGRKCFVHIYGSMQPGRPSGGRVRSGEGGREGGITSLPLHPCTTHVNDLTPRGFSGQGHARLDLERRLTRANGQGGWRARGKPVICCGMRSFSPGFSRREGDSPRGEGKGQRRERLCKSHCFLWLRRQHLIDWGSSNDPHFGCTHAHRERDVEAAFLLL